MARSYFISGYGYFNETGARLELYTGGGYVNETSGNGGGGTPGSVLVHHKRRGQAGSVQRGTGGAIGGLVFNT